MHGLKEQAHWAAQLKRDVQVALTATSLTGLRSLARTYNVTLPSTDLETARKRVLKQLEANLRAAGTRRRRASAAPQGSTVSTSPACSSASSVQNLLADSEEAFPVAAAAAASVAVPATASVAMPAAAAAASAAVTAAADASPGSPVAPKQCADGTRSADSISESATPVRSIPLPNFTSPPPSPPALLQATCQQATVEAEDGAPLAPQPSSQRAASVLQPQPAAAACRPQPASLPSSADAPPPAVQPAARPAPPPRPASALQSTPADQQQMASMAKQLAEMQQQLGALSSQFAELQQEVRQLAESQLKHADVPRQLSQAQRQLTATHSAGMRNSSDITAVQQQLSEMQAAMLRFAATHDSVSLLQSKQQQLQQRMQQGECASSVVLKCPEALPTEDTAGHAQRLFQQQLQLQVTVLRVQPLRSSDSGAQRRHCYRVDLGSRGERTKVLRVKAQRLRGTHFSIDALLTPEQRASKQQLQPVARQAKGAGRDVRWRYGQLIIDGKSYAGPGSIPAPSQSAAAPSTSHAAADAPTAPGDGWQTVQRRKPKAVTGQQGKGSSKRALFVPPAAAPSYADVTKQLIAKQPAIVPRSTKAAAGKGKAAGGAGSSAAAGNGKAAAGSTGNKVATGNGKVAASRAGSKAQQPATKAGSRASSEAAGASSAAPSPSTRA